MQTGLGPSGTGYLLMITPACNCDAGAAIDSLDVIGISMVTTTPIPNAAIKINNKSGLRFTIFLSLIQCLTSKRFWLSLEPFTSIPYGIRTNVY